LGKPARHLPRVFVSVFVVFESSWFLLLR
jgi:hypothetical protein